MKVNVNLVFGLLMTTLVFFGLSGLGYHLGVLGFVGLALLSYPWTMASGNVYSLWGGVSERNICSFFGVFQKAENSAVQVLGISIYQRADTTLQVFGLSLYQRADDEAAQIFGVSFYQRSSGKAAQLLGITIYQQAVVESTQGAGVAIYQKSSGGDIYGLFGITLWKQASQNIEQVLGLGFFQRADAINQRVGVTLIRKAKSVTYSTADITLINLNT